MLYNANLDRAPARRQTLAELRAALKKWEARNGGDRNGNSEVISLDDLDLDEHHVRFSFFCPYGVLLLVITKSPRFFL